MNFSAKKFLNKDIYILLAAIAINYHDGNSGYNLLLSRAFSVGIPLTVGFRPQLVVVSGLSVGIPLTVGLRPQLVVSGLSVGIPLTVGFRPQLVVVSGLSVGIPLTVGFRLSRSLRLP
jgi:predicted membrane protein